MTHNYSKLKIYDLSLSLATSCIKHFAERTPRVLSEHIMKTAISIPSNIAEGSQRVSNKDFSRFLSYAVGSCAELNCQLSIAKEVTPHDGVITNLLLRCQELQKAIWGFIYALHNRKT